jgi:hypothetical protein
VPIVSYEQLCEAQNMLHLFRRQGEKLLCFIIVRHNRFRFSNSKYIEIYKDEISILNGTKILKT